MATILGKRFSKEYNLEKVKILMKHKDSFVLSSNQSKIIISSDLINNDKNDLTVDYDCDYKNTEFDGNSGFHYIFKEHFGIVIHCCMGNAMTVGKEFSNCGNFFTLLNIDSKIGFSLRNELWAITSLESIPTDSGSLEEIIYLIREANNYLEKTKKVCRDHEDNTIIRGFLEDELTSLDLKYFECLPIMDKIQLYPEYDGINNFVNPINTPVVKISKGEGKRTYYLGYDVGVFILSDDTWRMIFLENKRYGNGVTKWTPVSEVSGAYTRQYSEIFKLIKEEE